MKTENGNALFIILAAIGMLAALTYAVTQSSRGSSNLDKEAIEIAINEIIQQGSQLEHGLKRFLLLNEYDIGEIDMYDANKGFNGDRTLCTANECNLFHPAGGGLSAPQLPNAAFDSGPTSCTGGLYNGRYKYSLRVTSFDNIGSDLPEIVLYYNCVRDDVCDRLNYKMGVLDPGDADIEHSKGTFGSDYLGFNGSGTFSGLTVDFMGSEDARIAGQKVYCDKSPSVSQGNTLFYVIMAR